MKKTCILYFILFTSCFITLNAEQLVSEISRGTLYAEYTEALAHDLGYYTMINSLRTRSAEYIRKLDYTIRSFVQDLRFRNKQLRANAYAYDLPEMLTNLERSFDAYFRALDITFILIGNEMDANDNTIEEKTEFIQHEMHRMQSSINTLISQSEVRFAQVLT